MTDEKRARLGVALAIVITILIQALVTLRYRPSPALGEDAPPERFSAARAVKVLGRVLGDGSPHAVATIQNERVREHIEHELRELGLSPELQRGPACSRFGTCAEVANVIAKIRGQNPGRPILLAAHYDSVPAAPGAGDDGAGVATLLEVARIFVHDPPSRPVVLLFGDGEELGLLGAELFVRRYRELRDIDAVVNVEARGTSGPSLLFETRRGSARFARVAAHALERPITSSLSATIYERLPNDTDLTVLSRHGLPGINFGFIEDVSHYHTPLDDLEHLDRASVQHHGDNVLAVTRALADGVASDTTGEAVWFDVLASVVVRWPIELTWPLVGMSLLLFAVAGAIAARRVELGLAETVRALFVMPALFALAGALGVLVDALLRGLGAIPAPFIAHPLPVIACMWALGIATLCLGSLASGREPRALAHFAATWMWWLMFAAALASQLAAVSYVALAPVALAAIASLVASASKRLAGVVVFVPWVGVLLIWLGIVDLLVEAIGFFTVAIYPLVIMLALSPLVPVISRLSVRARLLGSAGLLCVALIAIATAALVPKFSPATPQRVTYALHIDADARRARWMVESPFGPVPERMLAAANFERTAGTAYPWLGALYDKAHAAPAALDALLPGPVLENVESGVAAGRRRVRAHLRSQRGAELLALALPSSSTANLKIAGLDATARDFTDARVWIWAGAPTGVPIEIDMPASEPAEVMLIDHSYGLPDAAGFLRDARPSNAVASQLGDVTVVTRRARL